MLAPVSQRVPLTLILFRNPTASVHAVHLYSSYDWRNRSYR